MEHDKEQETKPEKINQLEPKSNRLKALVELTHGDGPVDKTSQKRFIKVKNKVKSLQKSRIKVKKRRSGNSTSSKSSSSSLGLSSSLDGKHKQKFYRVKKEKVLSGVNKRMTKVKKRKTPIEASSSAKSTTSTKSMSATEKKQQPIDKNANSSNIPSESCEIELSTKSVDSEHSLRTSESSKKKKPVAIAINETLEKKTKKIKESSPSSSEKSYCSVSTKKSNKTIEAPSKGKLTEGTLPLESSLIRLESPSSVLSNSSNDSSETSISCDLSYRESSKEAVCKGKKAHSKKSGTSKSFNTVKRQQNFLTSSDEDICATSGSSFKNPEEKTEKEKVENVQKTFYRMKSTKVNTSSRQLVKVKRLKSAPIQEGSHKKKIRLPKGNKPTHSPGGQPEIRVLETALEVTEPSLVEFCSEKTEKSLKVDAQTQEFSKIIEEANFTLNLANDQIHTIVSEQVTKKEEADQKSNPKEQTVETSKVEPKEMSAVVSKAQVSVTTDDNTQSYSPGNSIYGSCVPKDKSDQPDAKSLADKLTLSGTKQKHDDDLFNGKEMLKSIKQTAESTSQKYVEKNNKLSTEVTTSSSDIVCSQENKSTKLPCKVPPVLNSPNALIGDCPSTIQLTTDKKETQSTVFKEQTGNKSIFKAAIDNDQIAEPQGGSKKNDDEPQEGRQGKNPKAYHVMITMDCQLNIDELKGAISTKEPHSNSNVISLGNKQNLLLQELYPSEDLPQAEKVPQVPSPKLTDATVHTTAPEDSQHPSGEAADNAAHSAGSKQVDAQEESHSLASTLVVVTVIAFATFFVAKAFLR